MGVFGGVLWGLPPFPSGWVSLMLPVRESPWPPPRPPPRPRRPRWSGCLRDVLGFATKEIRQYLNQKSVIQNITIAKNWLHPQRIWVSCNQFTGSVWQDLSPLCLFLIVTTFSDNILPLKHTSSHGQYYYKITLFTLAQNPSPPMGLLTAVTGSLRQWVEPETRSVRFMLV